MSLIKKKIASLTNKLFNKLNIQIVKRSFYEKLKANQISDLELLKKIEKDQRLNFIDYLNLSKSQLRQDLFVLSEMNFKKNGFFVDFGATNGFDLSNSYLLETKFNWNGILAEPAKYWHDELRRNRKVNIDTDCVWFETGKELLFNDVDDAKLSTIDQFLKNDQYGHLRKKRKQYKVKTISLNDLLDKYSAPELMDYLSIDTEGSELEILKSFNFDKYKFKVITCEHNHNDNREKLYNLLSQNGYKRKFTEISKFEDWYVFND